jgi:hypothetical protein
MVRELFATDICRDSSSVRHQAERRTQRITVMCIQGSAQPPHLAGRQVTPTRRHVPFLFKWIPDTASRTRLKRLSS